MTTGQSSPAAEGLATWMLDLLVCPACRAHVRADGDVLRCAGCQVAYPVRAGIPRFVGALDPVASRTRASFGYEWQHFSDWRASGQTNFGDYFGDLDLASLREAVVLDAGCGMGRHARMIAPHVGRLVALDFSEAVDEAGRTLAACPHVRCVQGDLTRPPLRDGSFDYVYSLGVLHHLENTAGALRTLVRLVRPGGRLRLYLYWQPSGWRGGLLRLVNLTRPITTRLPFGVLRRVVWSLSVLLWAGVILPYRALARAGVTGVTRLPLFQYTKYPFVILYNDQFDRFSAPIEKRYTEAEVRRLLATAGLEQITVRARYGWIGEGVRPGGGAD